MLFRSPSDSRAANPDGFLRTDQVSSFLIEKVKQLNVIAKERGQTMAEMALAWVLKDSRVTSLIVGARNITQLKDNLKALENLNFIKEELIKIDAILDGATL